MLEKNSDTLAPRTRLRITTAPIYIQTANLEDRLRNIEANRANFDDERLPS